MLVASSIVSCKKSGTNAGGPITEAYYIHLLQPQVILGKQKLQLPLVGMKRNYRLHLIMQAVKVPMD